jgi:WD40 repeat protein
MAGIVSIAVGPEWVVAGCQDDCARVFRAADGTRPVHTWPSPGGAVGALALGPGGTFAVMGTLSGRVRVVRMPGGEPLADLPAHSDEATSVALTADGQMLATASLDRTIKLWIPDGNSYQELMSLGPYNGGVMAARFGPSGKTLAFLVKNERALRIWHLDRLKARLDQMQLRW